MALLIAVIVLLMMSALAVNALQHAGDEAVGSGSSRRKDATLYAAESGMAMMRLRLFDWMFDPQKKPIEFYDPALVKDSFGNPIEVIGAPPDNGGLAAMPAKIEPASNAKKKSGDGNDMRQGHPSSMTFVTIRPDITAKDITNGLVHIQTQFKVPEDPGKGAY